MRLLASIVLFVVLLLIVLNFSGCGRQYGRSSRYLIPTGYVGPIQLEYEVPGAPALAMEEGRYLVRISPQGRAQTSSKLDEGWHDPDDFYYVSGEVRKRLPVEDDPYPTGTVPPAPLVRGGNVEVGSNTNMHVAVRWFIGTDKQFDNYKKKHGGW